MPALPPLRTLRLTRITVHAGTREGRPYVILPSGAVVPLRVHQMAALLREDAWHAEYERRGGG